MVKHYRFVNSEGNEFNVISDSEENARIRAKLNDDYKLVASFDLSKDWQV